MAKFGRPLRSPEQFGEGTRPERGGDEARDEGGFAEGEYGRGPMPYLKSKHGEHAAGLPIETHSGTAGRGGSGIIGKHDDFKGRTEDVEHPTSHADFEKLGADGPTEPGGKD